MGLGKRVAGGGKVAKSSGDANIGRHISKTELYEPWVPLSAVFSLKIPQEKGRPLRTEFYKK